LPLITETYHGASIGLDTFIRSRDACGGAPPLPSLAIQATAPAAAALAIGGPGDANPASGGASGVLSCSGVSVRGSSRRRPMGSVVAVSI